MKLEIKGLTRRFGTFTANDSIDLTVEPGEIHCLLGENGAGKSTLMNMLYGLLEPTEGEIRVDGQPVHFRSPADAIAAGIGMVHQHFMLVPVFTVAENVMLGREQTRGLGVLDRRRAAAVVRELSERYRLAVDPDALVEDLPVGVQQRVEILKALANEARVLILDEPTAVLTPQEIDELMEIMRSLKEQGTSIVFITHKLREVKAVGDRITVIRRGKVVGTAAPSAPETELAEMMVGRAVRLVVDKQPPTVGRPVLQVEHVTVIDPRGATVVEDVSLEARAGEVLGIAGVQGNGQTELVKTLLGLVRPDAGRIVLDGRDLTRQGPRECLEAGIGYVPEDRAHDGSPRIRTWLVLADDAGPARVDLHERVLNSVLGKLPVTADEVRRAAQRARRRLHERRELLVDTATARPRDSHHHLNLTEAEGRRVASAVRRVFGLSPSAPARAGWTAAACAARRRRVSRPS